MAERSRTRRSYSPPAHRSKRDHYSHDRESDVRRHSPPAHRRDHHSRHDTDKESDSRESHQHRTHERRKHSRPDQREHREGAPCDRSDDVGSHDSKRPRRDRDRGSRDEARSRTSDHRLLEGENKDLPSHSSKSHEDDTAHEFGGKKGEVESSKEVKPDYGLSGKLTAETNTYKGVVIQYCEPPEARKPKVRWRLYQFKEDKDLPILYVHRQSAYLVGRDRRVVDLPVDHPSCSKQHAVLQYRLVSYEKEDGTNGKKVKPYIIDLSSTNGTYVNNQRIEPARYVELKEKDILKFGFSSREYVVLHENSKEEVDEDVGED